MMTLHGYSLIEAMPGHYSPHACVHDWILEYLIGKFDVALFGLAMHCIALSASQKNASKSHGISLQAFIASLTVSFCLFMTELIIFICARNFVKQI